MRVSFCRWAFFIRIPISYHFHCCQTHFSVIRGLKASRVLLFLVPRLFVLALFKYSYAMNEARDPDVFINTYTYEVTIDCPRCGVH